MSASPSQLSVLAVLESLCAADDPFAGRPLKELSEGADHSRIFRALVSLEASGWAERTPGGAWRPTPKAGRLSENVRRALADLGAAYLGGVR